MNEERTRGHWSKTSPETAQWVGDFKLLALAAKVPRLEAVNIHVRHQFSRPLGRGRSYDPGAIYPAIKAAIDGIVLAKVIPDDSGRYLRCISMYAPEKALKDAVIITIEEV